MCTIFLKVHYDVWQLSIAHSDGIESNDEGMKDDNEQTLKELYKKQKFNWNGRKIDAFHLEIVLPDKEQTIS